MNRDQVAQLKLSNKKKERDVLALRKDFEDFLTKTNQTEISPKEFSFFSNSHAPWTQERRIIQPKTLPIPIPEKKMSSSIFVPKNKIENNGEESL